MLQSFTGKTYRDKNPSPLSVQNLLGKNLSEKNLSQTKPIRRKPRGGGKTYKQDKTPWGKNLCYPFLLCGLNLTLKSGISSSRCSGQESNVVILCTVMKTLFARISHISSQKLIDANIRILIGYYYFTWENSKGHGCRHRNFDTIRILTIDVVEETTECLQKIQIFIEIMMRSHNKLLELHLKVPE
jgi:hypothetical protein